MSGTILTIGATKLLHAIILATQRFPGASFGALFAAKSSTLAVAERRLNARVPEPGDCSAQATRPKPACRLCGLCYVKRQPARHLRQLTSSAMGRRD
jgi:hypothetical protein